MPDFSTRAALESILGWNDVPVAITETELALNEVAIRIHTAGFEIAANGLVHFNNLLVDSLVVTDLEANNASHLNGKLEADLNVNSAIEAVTADTLAGHLESQLNVNSAAFATTAESANTANSALFANNASFFNGQAASFYLDVTNMDAGIMASARLPIANSTANGIVTAGTQTLGGDKTFANTVEVDSGFVIPVGVNKYVTA